MTWEETALALMCLLAAFYLFKKLQKSNENYENNNCGCIK
tara:strand:- start:1307 stop:1426 length:120 start_codon:yes stop_codon:yes gene_type:complete